MECATDFLDLSDPESTFLVEVDHGFKCYKSCSATYQGVRSSTVIFVDWGGWVATKQRMEERKSVYKNDRSTGVAVPAPVLGVRRGRRSERGAVHSAGGRQSRNTNKKRRLCMRLAVSFTDSPCCSSVCLCVLRCIYVCFCVQVCVLICVRISPADMSALCIH